MERFNVLIEKMRKQGETGTREELLIKALSDYSSKNSPRGENVPSTKIVITHFPSCNKAETGAGEISKSDLEKAYCDAVVNENVIPVTMKDWSTRLNAFLQFNHKDLLEDFGNVTAKFAKPLLRVILAERLKH